ncbi:unnamed protein product [Sphagnum jensenii]
MEPVGVNNYVRHTRKGQHYKTKEALSFEEIGAIACRDIRVDGKAYWVRIWVFQGKGSKGDIDNYAKQPLDLLVKCGVIDSDAKVIELHLRKERDWDNPRTEIYVEAV